MSHSLSSNDRVTQHLALSSLLRKRVQGARLSPAVLVVDDSCTDANFIQVPLRRLLGDAAGIVVANTIETMQAALDARAFDVVVLDDHMDRGARAETTVALIRAKQSTVPIILVSQLLTSTRRFQLAQLGLVAVFEKEDLNSVVLGGAILDAIGHSTLR
jgi:DNA-binding NtrC family response regulator